MMNISTNEMRDLVTNQKLGILCLSNQNAMYNNNNEKTMNMQMSFIRGKFEKYM